MKTGWVKDGATWYYLEPSGAMKTGNVTINGQNYTFGTTGEKITTTTQATNNVTQETDKVTTSNGGSGGGSISKNSESSNSAYKSLYGTWTVEEHIPSNIHSTLNDNNINACINQQFTISDNKIEASVMTLNNPKVKESTLTASEFSNKYRDSFENLGISADKVKFVHISQDNKPNRSVDVLVADDGKTYALLRGSLFKLEKK